MDDDTLLRALADLARDSRRVEADLVAHIGEVDARRLYAREAEPSMFAYRTGVLRFSEAEAYLRITAARAAREHPVLIDMLRDGRLHLSGIAKLAPHLTAENRDDLLQRASHKSKRQIEELMAVVTPRPDVPAAVRKLPQPPAGVGLELRPGGAPPPPTPPPPAVLQPLAPARYKVQFTASDALRDKIERLERLMPGADLAAVIDRAVTETLQRLEARRFAATRTPRKSLTEASVAPGSRYIPAPTRRAVHDRDGGRCAYRDAAGRRCTATGALEFHHRHPFGLGGGHDPGNLALLCRAHNLYLAEQDYGRAFHRPVTSTHAVLPGARPHA
jgi:hypothetical protein